MKARLISKLFYKHVISLHSLSMISHIMDVCKKSIWLKHWPLSYSKIMASTTEENKSKFYGDGITCTDDHQMIVPICPK